MQLICRAGVTTAIETRNRDCVLRYSCLEQALFLKGDPNEKNH